MNPTIVFDLDGTLVDTAPDLLASLNHCIAGAGLAAVDGKALRRYVGMGGRVMIERAFRAQQRELAEGQLDSLLALFIEHYGSNMPGESKLFEGAGGALDRFEAAGYAAAVCTNKQESLATALIGSLGLSHRFGAIAGGDTFAFRKPDARHLTETIRRLGGDPARAIMIGDSQTDIDTAKAAGIPVVAVDFGYTERHVREFEPSHVISHFDELTVELAESLIRAASR